MTFFEKLISKAAALKGADLVLSCGARPSLKVNGGLTALAPDIMTPLTMKDIVGELLNEAELRKLIEDKTLDLCHSFEGGVRVRLNIYFQRTQLAIIGRILPNVIPELSSLGVSKVLPSLLKSRSGLILITGPAGSGKSTTLASAVEYLNEHREYHIISIENPIEYEHINKASIIEQIEIGQDAPSYASALKGTLRRAPDVIIVGEMRDYESIQNALLLAETGHLVLGTLHSHDASNAVGRMADVFPEDMLSQIYCTLSQVLLGVFAQRLVPRSNAKGVVLATEVLIATQAVKNLIRDRREEQLYSVIQSSGQIGMTTLNSSLGALIDADLIGVDEAITQSTRPASLIKKYKQYA